MLTENKKNDVREITNILKELDRVSIMIIKSNATVLLARQELADSRMNQQTDHVPELTVK